MNLLYDNGDDMLPRWQLEIELDERLSQEKNRLIKKIQGLPKYGRMKSDYYNRLVRVDDVIEAIEKND